MAKNSKKNLVKRNEVYAEIKKAKGTPCQVVKGLYSYKGSETKALNKVLPANANDLCLLIGTIQSEMLVGTPAMVTVKDASGKAVKDENGNIKKVEKVNSKGEVVVVKFAQSLLITWVLRHQGDELREMCRVAHEKELARRAEKKAAKDAAAANEEKVAA